MSSPTKHLQLAIDVDSDPITGSVTEDAEDAQRFCGWIELVAAIEAARSSLPLDTGWGKIRFETLGSIPGAKASGL